MRSMLPCLTVFLAPAALAGPVFRPLPFSGGLALSKDGSTVVGSTSGRAFRFSEGSGFAFLAAESGAISSTLTAVNAGGDVAGGSMSFPSRFGSGFPDEFKGALSINGGPLQSQPWTRSRIVGLSDDGDAVALNYEDLVFADYFAGFHRRSTNQDLGLTDSAHGSATCFAVNVSASGARVIGSINNAGSRAVYWDVNAPGGNSAPVYFLPGNPPGTANDVSDDGTVIVGTRGPGNSLSAYRWKEGVGQTILGDFPGGSNMTATRVSGDGNVVIGDSVSGTLGTRSFYWTQAGGLQLFSSYLAGLGIEAAGWSEFRAIDLSRDGRVILGSGKNPAGQIRSFLVYVNRCSADVDSSGFVDTDDYDAFVAAFEAGAGDADFDHSGFVDLDDFTAFVHAFEAGC